MPSYFNIFLSISDISISYVGGMETINSHKAIHLLVILTLVSLSVLMGQLHIGNSVTDVSDLSLSLISQVSHPAVRGGRNIVTYVSTEKLFRGYGSSRKDHVEKYEWD